LQLEQSERALCASDVYALGRNLQDLSGGHVSHIIQCDGVPDFDGFFDAG
jgi:hypothetical protein